MRDNLFKKLGMVGGSINTCYYIQNYFNTSFLENLSLSDSNLYSYMPFLVYFYHKNPGNIEMGLRKVCLSFYCKSIIRSYLILYT